MTDLMAISRIQRIKTGVMRRLPPKVRVALRDQYQRARLRRGTDPLGQPAQHEEFLATHLARLDLDPAVPTTYLEFGVYQGASMAAAVRAFDRARIHGARFVGFDSFAGLPPGSEDEGWGTGWFVTSRATTEWNLRRHGVLDRVELIEGWFEQTCTPQLAARLGRADVVMIDCDIYSATVTTLDFVAPLLSDPCIVILDDWYEFDRVRPRAEGQVKALDEFRARTPGLIVEELGRVSYCGMGFLLRGTRATQRDEVPVS